MSVKNCQSCGTQVPEDAKFCPTCGKEIGVRVCSACGNELHEGDCFCQSCGKEAALPPAQPPKQSQRLHLHKWRKLDIIPVVLIVILLAFALYHFGPFNFNWFGAKVAQPQTISATENTALWVRANTALAAFLGEGTKTFGRAQSVPMTKQDLAPLSQYLNDFTQAVNAIKGVTPPSEQALMHRALLPIYQKMIDPMAGIRDALFSNDTSSADLEWHKLALLLDEVSGTTEILTLEPSDVAAATPTPTPTTTSTPTSTPTPTPTPSPSPSPTPSPIVTTLPAAIQVVVSKVLFSDDFSNATSGWAVSSSDSGDVTYENGEYSALVKKAQTFIVGWNRSMGSQTDFAVEVEGRLLSSENDGEYGLIFRRESPDAGNSNFYLFAVNNGSYKLQKYFQGAWSNIQTWKASSDIGTGQSTNRLKLVCKGTQIDLYANGQRLTSLTDASISSGYIGLEAAQLNSHVHFDNLKLYAVK